MVGGIGALVGLQWTRKASVFVCVCGEGGFYRQGERMEGTGGCCMLGAGNCFSSGDFCLFLLSLSLSCFSL